jgi:hypothetical protein
MFIKSFDVLIVCHSKDFHKLPTVIKFVKTNVLNFKKIHIITNVEPNFQEDNVIFHNEKNILPVDFDKIKYRPTWTYQQLLKLLQNVTQDWFLSIDADTLITRQINPIANGNAKFYINQNDQEYEPYFNFCKKLKVSKVKEHTFISEIMMFNRSFIKEMFSKADLKTNNDILNFIYDTVEDSCHLSEFELYGNFIESTYPNEYETKDIKGWGFGMGSYDIDFWNQNRMTVIFEVYGIHYDVMSFHTYN